VIIHVLALRIIDCISWRCYLSWLKLIVMKLPRMNDKPQLKLILKDCQRIQAIEIFYSKIWWVKIMQNNKWVKVPSKTIIQLINKANQNLNRSDREKTMAEADNKESKIFRTTDSKIRNQLMLLEIKHNHNSILEVELVPITNRFKTILEANRPSTMKM